MSVVMLVRYVGEKNSLVKNFEYVGEKIACW